MSFQRECWPLVALYLGVFDWKVQRFCWPKGTSLECTESIYMKIMKAACVCDELCHLKRRSWTNREFQRFAYKACMGPYSSLKHANS